MKFCRIEIQHRSLWAKTKELAELVPFRRLWERSHPLAIASVWKLPVFMAPDLLVPSSKPATAGHILLSWHHALDLALLRIFVLTLRQNHLLALKSTD